MVDAMSPPITVRAMGKYRALKMLVVPNASGSKPTTVVPAVIRMGRSRSRHPSRIARARGSPARR